MKLPPKSLLTTKLANYAAIGLALVLVLVPFHALLTVGLSQVVGGYDGLRVWKELLLVLLLPVVVMVVWRNRPLWRQLQRSRLFWAVMLYVALQVLLGLVALSKGQVNSFALTYAWIINIRPFLILLIAWVLASNVSWLHANWRRLLLWPAAVVVVFGLLQVFVLPYDVLRTVGYGPATIAAYETVDQKIDYLRVQSTLRGSNPLGAYLAVVTAALGVLLIAVLRGRGWRSWRAWLLTASLLASLTLLVHTYSRSAYIGVVVGLAVVAGLLVLGSARLRRWALVGSAVSVLMLAGLFVAFRHNDRVENILFHTDEHSQSAMSSNEQRASAQLSGWRDVAREPFGRGPGTAGPASQHNRQPGRIAENYYLQLGQETGWLGLGLFLAVIFMIGRQLWQRRYDSLAAALLASLIGLSVVNIVQHAWADDTLALVWWGLAGIAIATPLTSRPARQQSTVKRSI